MISFLIPKMLRIENVREILIQKFILEQICPNCLRQNFGVQGHLSVRFNIREKTVLGKLFDAVDFTCTYISVVIFVHATAPMEGHCRKKHQILRDHTFSHKKQQIFQIFFIQLQLIHVRNTHSIVIGSLVCAERLSGPTGTNKFSNFLFAPTKVICKYFYWLIFLFIYWFKPYSYARFTKHSLSLFNCLGGLDFWRHWTFLIIVSIVNGPIAGSNRLTNETSSMHVCKSSFIELTRFLTNQSSEISF